MKTFDVRLTPDRGGKARIALLSCIHIGHTCHDRKRFGEWMGGVIKDKACYVIQLGDTIDNGTRAAPGASIFEQTKSPREQVKEAFSVLQPLVATKRVLFWHESNHSYRTYKESGFFTAEELLANEFGVPWAGWQAISTIHVGPQTYVVHSMHGAGGGTSLAGAITATSKQAMIAEADVYARGHHHRPASTRQIRYRPRREGGLDRREVVYAATGCALAYDDSYGEMGGFIPNSYSMTVVEFDAKRKKISVTI